MKKITLTIFLFAVVYGLNAQRKKDWKPQSLNHQIGFSLGTANYLGDLANKSVVPIIGGLNGKAFRPTLGMNYRYNFTYFTSIRAEVVYARLYGNDANTNGDPHRLNRNLHFKTDLLDFSAMIEWNILKYEIGSKKRNFTPYIGVGIAGFYFNPQAELDGKWYELQPLGLEGQGKNGVKKYAQVNVAIPFTTGIKYNVNKSLALGVEFQYRITFTDYLDDVSDNKYLPKQFFYDNYSAEEAKLRDQLAYRAIDSSLSPRATDVRGDPKGNDHYFVFLLTLAYKIPNEGRFFPKVR